MKNKQVFIMRIFTLFYVFAYVCLSPLNTYSYQVQSDEEYLLMDTLAIEAGADKSSNFHDYTRIYSNYFKDIKNQPITFLEIGIYKGASVKLWEDYFPYADLHFIDINPSSIVYHSSRSHYHFIDQKNIAQLQSFAQSLNKGFDIIIDDGGHTMEMQINSFIALFPYVKSGGLYIIEDLHTSYWKEYGGGGSKAIPKTNKYSTIEFLKSKIDDLNFIGAHTGRAKTFNRSQDLINQLDLWKKSIRSMHFYDSVCIIIKK